MNRRRRRSRLACASVVLALFAPGCLSSAPTPPATLRLADATETASRQGTEPTGKGVTTGISTPAAPAPSPGLQEDPGAPPPDESDDSTIEDDVQIQEPVPTAENKPVVHPLEDLSDADLEQMVIEEPSSLGPMSIGRTNGGMLFNAVRMPQGEHWELIDPAHAWGTQETIDSLIRCIDTLQRQFPDSPKLQIGHISGRRGGYLSPHRSHQAGRDVDVSYYYTKPASWFARAHAKNLDRARTWAFVRALITESDVELILIDGGLQRLLREYALEIGEDPDWVDGIFRGVRGKQPALIRHARGHATHIHIRFYSPIARETARRAHPLLIKHGKVKPPLVFVRHRARKGDTLGRLANKYGTTVEAIQRANGLRSTVIRAKHTYRIPQKGGVPKTHDRPIVIPPRRLPPHPPKNPPSP